MPDGATDLTDEAVQAGAVSRAPVLRVVPHPNLDACGYNPPRTHCVYSVRWSVPIICQYRETGFAPGCPACADIRRWQLETGAERLPPAGPKGTPPHLWWEDMAEVANLRAGLIPAEQRLAIPAEQQLAAALYDWSDLAGRVVGLVTRTPPTLSPLQRVAVGGVLVALLEEELLSARQGLAQLSRTARTAADPRTGRAPAKGTIARFGGITRVTLDAYLRADGTAGDASG